ncbi:tesmin-like [Gopherus flavomarginatus]|uniref:tesmin-like n=1 Tax=Gopherus flavomarginatus TaxID=286002 RepID=UPI0021CBCD8C|nr:tesmin-like [Gopherus flavomarginatus]
MEAERRELVAGRGEEERLTKKNFDLEKLNIPKEKNRYEQTEIPTVAMENQTLLGGISSTEGGFITEIFSQNSPFSFEILNFENTVINKPGEEEFPSSQDRHLCTMAVGETLLDQFKYPLTIESQNTILTVKIHPLVEDNHDNEILGNYQKLQDLNPSEEAKHIYPPYPPSHSYNVHFLSSLMMQHRNSNVLPLSTCPPEGTINQNVRMIPVFRPLLDPVTGGNNCICYDQFKGMINNCVQSQALPGSSDEPCSDNSTLPQTSAPVCDELAEVKEAIVSNMVNNQKEAVFQNSDAGETSCKLLTAQNIMEDPSSSQRKDSSPVVICQLKGGTEILCINSSGTRELKTVHLVPQYQKQDNDLQSDVPNPMTALLGQFLPIPGKVDLNEQQLENGSLQSVASSATFQSEVNLQGPTKMTLVGLPLSSWDTKSKKPCNCTKSQCLKLYCDCFASDDFCNNCNCNNCYNNPLHETERFKAIKACLDRNPEAFLPKIGKGKLGDIKPRHNKGCNCKRSGCLKNYCECFEAKIMCSSICKCIGCKNYEESPDRKTLMNMPNYTEIRNNEENILVSTSTFEMLPKSRRDRQPTTCISWEVVEATCACLLAQAEEAEKETYSVCLAEQMILEEFGRCLSQILHLEFKSKGLTVE